MTDPIDPNSPQNERTGTPLSLKIFLWLISLLLVSSMIFRAYNDPSSLHAPIWVIWLVASVMLLAPIIILIPENDGKRARFWYAVYSSAFSILICWVAFGPGERIFVSNSSFSYSLGQMRTSSISNEEQGRIFFGIFAVALVFASTWLWKKWREYEKPNTHSEKQTTSDVGKPKQSNKQNSYPRRGKRGAPSFTFKKTAKK